MSSLFGSPSPAGSPRSTASNVLTPNQKVQALLAQFDDSESDTPAHSRRSASVTNGGAHGEGESVNGLVSPSSDGDDSEEEDVFPGASRSRIAARLQGITTAATGAENNERGLASVLSPSKFADGSDGNNSIAQPVMRRRLLTKRKSSPPQEPTRLHASRSASPTTLASPGLHPPQRADLSTPLTDDSDPEDEDKPSTAGKSKFLALVEKHRQQRLAREAEEDAKRAARIESLKSQEKDVRQQRGSSPADTTDEESDLSQNDGAIQLSKQARPTRKASKKALEEMSRETQRMSRNMQLAHQARTKKKITKDSLLARFNFPVASSKAGLGSPQQNEAATASSSVAGSDTEAPSRHETPPTSPVQDGSHSGDAEKVLRQVSVAPQATENDIELTKAMNSSRSADKGKARAASEQPIPQSLPLNPIIAYSSHHLHQDLSEPVLQPSIKPHGPQRLLGKTKELEVDDSDSELEVITSRGDIRKYAAFEQLPKRKAKETASHLALRSLAHLIGGDDRKRSVNAAEMESSLRKAARLQAREERQHKIEELKAKGVMIQTSEEREREQQEVEDLLEKARQEAVEIQKREKALAKKDGTYSKDDFDDEESDEDDDFEEDEGENLSEDSADDEEDNLQEEEGEDESNILVDDAAEEDDSDGSASQESEAEDALSQSETELDDQVKLVASRKSRVNRVVSDDEDEEAPSEKLRSPQLPAPTKTPQSLLRSARKQIPGLQMSDDLPIGLTQAFAATMADSQSQDMETIPEQDSLTMTMDLPSPHIAMVPRLHRLDSVDVITDSQPASQTQPLNISLSFSETQAIPQSPASERRMSVTQFTPSQAQFEPTQDGGYLMSPFAGNRFSTETPQHPRPQSTIDTVILPIDAEQSPVMQRKARLIRGRANDNGSDDESHEAAVPMAFDVMRRAAKRKSHEQFDKSKSGAQKIVDEAAEESEDEYAGLGGASDEEVNDEENEDDRQMIDEDTQVGVGDEAKLAKLYADRERQRDEADVSKLLKDITTGALRRKRGNDDLDLSDEEDAMVRRREAKRREFAKMRRELLKDEAVGKIAEDKKKEAFLRSIEDRQVSDDEDNFDLPDSVVEDESQDKASQPAQELEGSGNPQTNDMPALKSKQPLQTAGASRLNQGTRSTGRETNMNRRPATLAEIRESVSFLIEEPDSQAGTIDLGLSDSEDEPEAYVNLDRHLESVEADENADDGDDLGDFIVDDDGQATDDSVFKKPTVPYSETRAPFSARRTQEQGTVVNRLRMLRESSSSSGSSGSTKMAFYSASSLTSVSFGKVPSLLRRATTNSSLGSMSGRDETVSATGVVTNKTERGKASDEKEFVRKGSGGRRNAVNFRPTVREEKMSQRAGVAKKSKAKKAGVGSLGALFRRDSWA